MLIELNRARKLKNMKLHLELVPKPCWYINVRSQVSPSVWNEIIHNVAKKANYKCEICSGVGDKWPVECHEIWKFFGGPDGHPDGYISTANPKEIFVQKLEGFIALCPLCHACKHLGYAQISGNYEVAVKHLATINNLSKSETDSYISDCFKTWSTLSKFGWTIDLSYLDQLKIPYTPISEKLTKH